MKRRSREEMSEYQRKRRGVTRVDVTPVTPDCNTHVTPSGKDVTPRENIVTPIVTPTGNMVSEGELGGRSQYLALEAMVKGLVDRMMELEGVCSDLRGRLGVIEERLRPGMSNRKDGGHPSELYGA